GSALFFPPLLLGCELGHALFVLGSSLCGFLLCLLFGSGRHDRRRFDRCAVLLVGVYRAFIVKADRHGASDVLSEDDDGGFGAGAWGLGVGIVGFGEFAVLVFL